MKWNFKIPSDGGHLNWVKSSPSIGKDGVIYVGSHNYKLYAIYQNGTEKWSFGTSGIIFSSPTIGNDGTIYVGSPHSQGIGVLYAINPNGTEKWVFETGGWIYSSPAIGDDGTIYIGSQDYNLYAIYPNGTLRWKFMTNGEIDDSSPAIGNDGTIYVGSYDGFVYAINRDGTLKWKYLTGDSIISSPALDKNDILFIGSMDGKIYAISPDGTERWGITIGAHIQSSPAIGQDGTIYIGSWDNHLYAIGGIKIEEPRQGCLYIGFREIGPTMSGNTLVIGRAPVKVSAFHEENVDRVEFYLDDQLIETVYETPFAVMLDETAFWKHTILAKAYYIDGSTPTDQMDVMIFNI